MTWPHRGPAQRKSPAVWDVPGKSTETRPLCWIAPDDSVAGDYFLRVHEIVWECSLGPLSPQYRAHPVDDPRPPPREQRRLIRESDRKNYTSHGYRALTSYAYAKDIVPGKLLALIHDQLTEGGRAPERSAVWVGVHDVDLARGVATVLGEKYSKVAATLGQFLPVAWDESLQGRQLRAVMLFWNDGEQAERSRVERVVALAQEFADRFTTVDQVRRRVVEQLSTEPLAIGHQVKLALAAAWTGQADAAGADGRRIDRRARTPAI